MSQTKCQLFDVSVEGPTALKNGANNATLDGSGNLSISAGNLVLANNSGIDFSATPDGSGNVTSELLDDYEEGTFTPIYEPADGAFTSITYDPGTSGKYTKIGDVCYVRIYLRTDAITVGTASGNIYVGGLPFTPITTTQGAALVVGFGSAWAGEIPSAILTRTGGEAAATLYYRTSVTGATTPNKVTDLDTTANDNVLYVTGFYNVD